MTPVETGNEKADARRVGFFFASADFPLARERVVLGCAHAIEGCAVMFNARPVRADADLAQGRALAALGMILFGIAAAVLLVGCAVQDQGQEPANPLADMPQPEELRFISADDATSTCIGDPKTPLCAVETLLACFARADRALCQRLDVNDVHLAPPSEHMRYKIISAKELTKEEIDQENELQPYANPPELWTIGYVKIVVSRPDGEDGMCHARNCKFADSPPAVGDECCKYTYIIKPTGDEWRLVSWWWWGEY